MGFRLTGGQVCVRDIFWLKTLRVYLCLRIIPYSHFSPVFMAAKLSGTLGYAGELFWFAYS